MAQFEVRVRGLTNDRVLDLTKIQPYMIGMDPTLRFPCNTMVEARALGILLAGAPGSGTVIVSSNNVEQPLK